MSTRRSKTIAAVTVASIAAAAIAIPTALIARPSEEDPAAATVRTTVAPVTEADASTRELVAILARPRQAGDAVPRPTEANDPAVLDDSQPGEAYDLSRRAIPNRDEQPVYVWPKQDGACFSTERVSSCVGVSELRERGVQVTLSGGSSGGVLVAGIARDGVREIEIVTGETSTPAPVVQNAFAARVDSFPTAARWTTPDGKEHVEEFRALPSEATGTPASK